MPAQKIIDTHLHLAPAVSLDVNHAAAMLDEDLVANNVRRAVVHHLLAQPWPAQDVAEALRRYPRLRAFINVDPLAMDACERLQQGIRQLGFIGLKLHPRLQRFDLNDPAVHRLVQMAGELEVPVLVDAFPDGDWLMMGFDPLVFARLAKACPGTRVIFGHFGGHHCVDFMMLAKRIPNMWFDLSYSLLYYGGSAVVANLIYCCRSMGYRRIFFGSDYPDRPIDKTIDLSLKAFAEHGVAGDELDALLWRNAAEFFAWTDV